MKNTSHVATLTLLALAGLTACTGAPDPEAAAGGPARAEDPAGRTRAPRTLPVPSSSLPPGHPPATGSPGGQLDWGVPDTWIEEPPMTPMRLAQYRVPGPAGDGECIVYYFGPGQGGDAQANALRWAGQFRQPGGEASESLMKLEEFSGAAVQVQIVEITGTYDGGMTMTDAPAEKKPGFMLLGAIAEGPDAPWFFKFTGPEATVRAQRDAFLEMLKSLRTVS